MKVYKTYRFALDPTPTQERALLSNLGAVRVAYNWGLARIKANLDQRAAEATYGIPEADRTPFEHWHPYSLKKHWNQAKHQVAPWWAENSKDAYATGLSYLYDALKNWSLTRRGERPGRKFGFPRFKSKRASVLSLVFSDTNCVRLTPDRHHVVLPRVRSVKTHESTRKLARRLENGSAQLKQTVVRREAGRWYVSFVCQVERASTHQSGNGSAIALDLGIKNLAVLSTGEVIPNPRHIERMRRRQSRLDRERSRKIGSREPRTGAPRMPSKRWLRATAQWIRSCHRVGSLRRDGIHKLTTRLARQYETVVIEDLHIAGLIRNRKTSRSIADAAWGRIRSQLAYKTVWNGGRLIVAGRFYPSSKTCSGCGVVKAKLTLSERTFICESCGLSLDRDLNAALNLAALAAEVDVAGSGSETLNGRGADQRTPLAGQVAVKRQPGRASARQTGTAVSQESARDNALSAC